MTIDELISELTRLKKNNKNSILVPINVYINTKDGLVSAGMCGFHMDDDGDLIIDTTKYDKDDEE